MGECGKDWCAGRIEPQTNYHRGNFDVYFNGAYNLAKYKTQWLAQRAEIATTEYFDLKGQQITGVPKLTPELRPQLLCPAGPVSGAADAFEHIPIQLFSERQSRRLHTTRCLQCHESRPRLRCRGSRLGGVPARPEFVRHGLLYRRQHMVEQCCPIGNLGSTAHLAGLVQVETVTRDFRQGGQFRAPGRGGSPYSGRRQLLDSGEYGDLTDLAALNCLTLSGRAEDRHFCRKVVTSTESNPCFSRERAAS